MGEEGHEPYVMFQALTRKAEAQAELKFTEILRENAEDRGSAGDARWALAWLERRRREDWWLRPEQPSSMPDEEMLAAFEAGAEKLRERIARKK